MTVAREHETAERDWLDLHLDHGIQALMSTPAVACVQVPGATPIRDYTRAADAGEIGRARRTHGGLDGARRAFERWLRAPWLTDRVVPVAQLKAWLDQMGLPQGPVRASLIELGASARDELRAALGPLGLIR